MQTKTLLSALLCLLFVGSAAAQTSTSQTSTTQRQGTIGRTARAAAAQTHIPSGTNMSVRVNETLNSETSQAGDRFTGTLTEDMMVDGMVVFPRGSEVAGRVISATPSGRLSSSGVLELTLNTIRQGNSYANISTTPFEVKGESHTKSNTTKIGGGAAIGAVIGAIAGGGKGAAIGAGVGAAAGAGTAAATGKKEAKVESEAVLRFVTSSTSSVAVGTVSQQRDGRTVYNEGDYRDEVRREDDPPVLTRRDRGNNTTTSNTTGQTNSNQSGTMTTNSDGTTSCNCSYDSQLFTARDRRVISSCLKATRGALPMSNARSTITRSVRAQLVKGNTLPAEVQDRVRSLPLSCVNQLQDLPNELERVVFERDVLLIDGQNRILDMFSVSASAASTSTVR